MTFFALRGFRLPAGLVLCCGGLFATTSTARSKRAHASGCNSGSFFGSGFAMKVAVHVQARGVYKLPAALSAEIGRIVVHWAYYEHYLTRLVWKLLNLTQAQGRFAVREPSAELRLDIIRDLAALKGPALDKGLLSSMRTRTEAAKSMRDLMAHGGWIRDRLDGWHVQYARGTWKQNNIKNGPKGSRKVAPEFTPVTPERLRAITADIKALIQDAKKLAKVIAPDES
jgi:hypothetical protein